MSATDCPVDVRESAGCGAQAPLPRLPCHESSNLNGTANRKRLFAAQENMRGYVRRVGEDRIGVLTVTTADQCRSLMEFQRRWNSLMTNFVRRLWRSGVWVRERQIRTGNWHGHALVDVGFEIRLGFPFEEVSLVTTGMSILGCVSCGSNCERKRLGMVLVGLNYCRSKVTG